MPRSRSKYELYKQASLGQQLGFKKPIFGKLAGSDPNISESIGFFLMFGKHKLIDLEDPSMKLCLDLLDVQRLARFATSEKVNEITKMGLMMPKADDVVDFD